MTWIMMLPFIMQFIELLNVKDSFANERKNFQLPDTNPPGILPFVIDA